MRLPVHIWLREENARPDELAGYFTEIARHLDAAPRKMRVVIESTVPASLDFDPTDGNPVATVCGEKARFSIRRRWIPEHPVPLDLGPSEGKKMRRTVLLVDPAENNRFHVRFRRWPVTPPYVLALFCLAATISAITVNAFAIAAAVTLLAFICIGAAFRRRR